MKNNKKKLETHVCGPFILSSCCNRYTALRMTRAINDQPICGVLKVFKILTEYNEKHNTSSKGNIKH